MKCLSFTVVSNFYLIENETLRCIQSHEKFHGSSDVRPLNVQSLSNREFYIKEIENRYVRKVNKNVFFYLQLLFSNMYVT